MSLFNNLFPLTTWLPTKFLCENSKYAGFECHFSSLKYDQIIRAKNICYRESNSIRGHGWPAYSTTRETIKMEEEEAGINASESGNGIGIVKFFEGKNILVTGATGFLAKALIEKVLRTTSVTKIYLLIRAKNNDAAFDRLTSEIIESDLFKCLKEMHGESYKCFILSKLIPVIGNIYEPNLGMDLISSQKIGEEIDLIVDSAANTTFDERYDILLDVNVSGPSQLMTFARKCKNLKLFVHYSTAYANGEREGLIFEKPFTMGESITKERITSICASTKFPSLSADSEIDLVSQLKKASQNNGINQMMKALGTERAKLYGWYETYTFTKAIGEMVINSMREEIPVLIIRPSIVTSSYKEPFAGWIQGFRVLDPLVISYGKGFLPGILADPDCLLDIVPVDLVVNATMASIAKHGCMQSPEVNIYHVASTVLNSLSFSQIFNYSYEYFLSFPFIDSKDEKVDIKKMRYFNKIADFSNYIWKELLKQHGLEDESELSERVKMRSKKKLEYLKHMSKLYEPYTSYKGRFDNGNMIKLMEDMSEEEKTSFGIDVSKVNWRDYFMQVHIPGLREHVLKGRRGIC